MVISSAEIRITLPTGTVAELPIQYSASAMETIDHLTLQDRFKIKGVGLLAVRSIMSVPTDMDAPTKDDWKRKITIFCKIVEERNPGQYCSYCGDEGCEDCMEDY